MRQDRSTPITETAEEPTGCGPDGYGGFAHHHRSVLDHRRSRLTSSEQAWVRRQVGNRTGRDRDETRKVLRSVCGIRKADSPEQKHFNQAQCEHAFGVSGRFAATELGGICEEFHSRA
jgi:hypothetical protein